MEKYVIWLALAAAAGSLSIEDPQTWNNLQENDVIPPPLEEYYLRHKSEIKFDKHRIVGGQVALANAYPHQVGLALTTLSGSQSWCGGSIISQYFIVTAAHCLENVQYATVIMGAHDRESPAEPGRVTVMVGSTNFIVHSGWSMQNMLNDIALIRLSTPITFNDRINAISLPSRSQAAMTFEGQPATISGWGNYEIKRLSRYLRHAQTTVISNNICRSYFSGLVHSTTICLDGTSGRGTCHGDSGGPLIIQAADGRFILAGLTSFGNPYSCQARWPTAFTRVSSYLSWISMFTGITIQN